MEANLNKSLDLKMGRLQIGSLYKVGSQDNLPTRSVGVTKVENSTMIPKMREAKPIRVGSKVKKALADAKKCRKHAYSPYSAFQVGAGLVAKNGKVFTGCNVENASYGGTVCAERVAIFKAVSQGVLEFSDIVVVTDAAEPAFPCAFCLQVMAEFFNPETKVWVANLKGIQSEHNFSTLLPRPFGPRQLRKARS